MPTKKPRLNLTLDKDNLAILTSIAKKKKESLASTAKSLIIEAIDLQEDIYFSKLAEKREKQTKKWISHKDVWK